ncbi:MAG TPA: hypothetical protein VHE99_12210 [Gammaproteobacteria bacterium]|nr:hypothetical protein [Gammaproteobacteria bacterium]
MQQKIDNLNEEKSEIDERIESCSDEITRLKNKTIDTEKELEIFTSTKNTEKRAYEQELRELQRQLAKLKEEEGTKPSVDDIENLESQIRVKQNFIADIEAELIEGKAEKNASIKKHQLTIDQLERTQASLTKGRDKIVGKIGSLESESAAEDKKARGKQTWQANVNRHADRLDDRAEDAHAKANNYGAAAIGCIVLTMLIPALAPVLIPTAVGLAGAACVEKKKELDVNKEISRHNEQVDRHLLKPPA